MRYLTTALVLVIAVLGGFYGGWKYSQSKITSSPAAAVTGPGAGTGAGQGAAGGGAPGGGGGNFARGGATLGQVTSLSGNVLTLKDAQGNTVKVTLPDGTTILKTSTASVTDLVPGVAVTVTGQRAADGSVTASSVTVIPAGLRPGPSVSPGG